MLNGSRFLILASCACFSAFKFTHNCVRFQHVLKAVAGDQIRPTLDDVERISRGLAAKKRGTGSRAVPHRLNAEERKEWDLAKVKRYVTLRGSGWRRERGDSPLANVYRLYCDSVGVPCITVERGLGIDANDRVTIDFSPLRTFNIADYVNEIKKEAQNSSSYGSCKEIDDRSDLSAMGWADDESILETNAIWRLPSASVAFTFQDRAESRGFAQVAALKYARGELNKHND